ncbi:Rieske (2Fe-2S) protein [Nonomuraea sp. NPDC050556]|uniref:Rieske (2Fe-2S) protein n=1 Tax=Nonomuraea sp. NPDC050556 TaxID=3364369 RepID=UPI0037BD0ED8
MGDDLHSRRTVIAGVGVGGLAVALAACGAGEQPVAATSSASAAPPAGGALTTTKDVPVGGGTIFKDQKVVVTQPTAGQFKCFSAICTHNGCTVGSVANGTIDCPCHGSKFNVADGSVANGPATKPLPEQPIKVDGDSISLA